MKQLILPDEYNGEKIYSLSEEDSHYLLRVQRRSIGFSVDFLDIESNLYKGTIVDINNNICQITLDKISSQRANRRSLTILQGIPKGKKIDLMIRQCVEVGVDNFFPILTENSVPQFKTKEDRDKKHKRWEKIVKEASQQSGTKKITTLEGIKSLPEALELIKKPFTGIFFHQVPLMNTSMHKILENPKENIVLVVGPEGGISPNEVELLKKYNFTPCLLGDNILRAETATTFALGAVQMILLERDIWNIS